MADAAVCGLPRIEDVQIALAAADVDTLAFLVHEHVICIAAELNVHDRSTVAVGKRGKSCGTSERHDDVAALGLSAIGKLVPMPSDHRPSSLRATRSKTMITWPAGSLRKIRLLLGSS